MDLPPQKERQHPSDSTHFTTKAVKAAERTAGAWHGAQDILAAARHEVAAMEARLEAAVGASPEEVAALEKQAAAARAKVVAALEAALARGPETCQFCRLSSRLESKWECDREAC